MGSHIIFYFYSLFYLYFFRTIIQFISGHVCCVGFIYTIQYKYCVCVCFFFFFFLNFYGFEAPNSVCLRLYWFIVIGFFIRFYTYIIRIYGEYRYYIYIAFICEVIPFVTIYFIYYFILACLFYFILNTISHMKTNKYTFFYLFLTHNLFYNKYCVLNAFISHLLFENNLN